MNHFKIIGLRPVLPQTNEFPVDGLTHFEKVEAIQKALYNQDRWFYFYQGIKIAENYESIEMNSLAKTDYSLFSTDSVNISLCAVVGRNGSGKSGLVELLVRTLNKLTAGGTLIGHPRL